MIGEILIVGIPFGDTCGFVRQVCVPTNEVDGIIEIITIGIPSARVVFVPDPGAIERLCIAVGIGLPRPGYEPHDFCAWRSRIEPEGRLLLDDRHLYVGGRTPALFRLFRCGVPIAPVLEDRADVVEILRHLVFVSGADRQPQRTKQQVGRPSATKL